MLGRGRPGRQKVRLHTAGKYRRGFIYFSCCSGFHPGYVICLGVQGRSGRRGFRVFVRRPGRTVRRVHQPAHVHGRQEQTGPDRRRHKVGGPIGIIVSLTWPPGFPVRTGGEGDSLTACYLYTPFQILSGRFHGQDHGRRHRRVRKNAKHHRAQDKQNNRYGRRRRSEFGKPTHRLHAERDLRTVVDQRPKLYTKPGDRVVVPNGMNERGCTECSRHRIEHIARTHGNAILSTVPG